MSTKRAGSSVVALLVCACAPACGGDDTGDSPFDTGMPTTQGEDGTGDGDGDGDTDTTNTGDGDGDTTNTGDGDGDGDQVCEFSACHMPHEPASDVGLASDAPVGCGGGRFEATAAISVGMYADPEAPRAVPYFGDFDADGADDLLVNFRKAGAGYVFPNDGTGGFSAQPALLDGGLFAGGWGGDIGDFDNDGNLDVLLGDHTRSGRAWRGSGALSFSESRSGLPDNVWFSGGGLADLDGDGNLDALFGLDQFATGFRLYHGDGNGNWSQGTPPQDAGSNLGYFAFADYDSDGDNDIFAFGKSGNEHDVVGLVFQNNGGSFSAVGAAGGGGARTSGANPVQGSVGDVNCDGKLDIASGGSLYFGDGNTWTPGPVVDGAAISHLADMNGDGNLDLVTHSPENGLALYINDGTGQTWTLDQDSGLPDAAYQQLGSGVLEAYGIDIGDADGNGSLDIVRMAGFSGGWLVEVWTR